jgi:hypothetical protein
MDGSQGASPPRGLGPALLAEGRGVTAPSTSLVAAPARPVPPERGAEGKEKREEGTCSAEREGFGETKSNTSKSNYAAPTRALLVLVRPGAGTSISDVELRLAVRAGRGS